MTLLVKGVDGRDIVSRAWEGKKVVCIAGGPTLTQQEVELVRTARERDEVRVIVVNDQYLIAPWADVLYFADNKWGKWHEQGLAKSWPWVKFSPEQVKQAFKNFAGQKVSIEHGNDTFRAKDVFLLQNRGPDGLCEKPDGVMTGSNSGYQALNIAFHSGGKPIFLVAYDMRFEGTRSHSHNGHPMKHDQSAYLGYAKRFETTQKPLRARGIDVFNCSPCSEVHAYPRKSLAECLALGV